MCVCTLNGPVGQNLAPEKYSNYYYYQASVSPPTSPSVTTASSACWIMVSNTVRSCFCGTIPFISCISLWKVSKISVSNKADAGAKGELMTRIKQKIQKAKKMIRMLSVYKPSKKSLTPNINVYRCEHAHSWLISFAKHMHTYLNN